MFRIINYFTKQTKQTMTIIIVTQDKLVQIKIFFGLMSETCISVLDLYICQIALRHIMCVIILMCWLLGLLPQVLAFGPASDKSSSVTHSLPHTTQNIIHFPWLASACVSVRANL